MNTAPRFSRRRVLRSLSYTLGVGSLASFGHVIAAPKKNVRVRRRRMNFHIEVNTNYVPVTIGVPDAVSDGDQLAFMMSQNSGQVFSLGEVYDVWVKCVDSANTTVNLNRVIGSYDNDTPVHLTFTGEGDENAVAFVTVLNTDNSPDQLVRITICNDPSFNSAAYKVVGPSGEIDVYKA